MSAAVQAPVTAGCPVCGATAFPDGWDVDVHLLVMHTTAAQDRAATVFDTLRAAVTRACEHCGEAYQPYRTHQRYCSPTCSSRARDRRGTERRNGHIHVEAVCEGCGGLYVKRVRVQRFCSKRCGDRYWKGLGPAWARPPLALEPRPAVGPAPVPVPEPAVPPVPVPLGAGFEPRRASGWPPDPGATVRPSAERTVQCPDCPWKVETSEQLVHHAAVHHGGPAPARWIDAGDELG